MTVEIDERPEAGYGTVRVDRPEADNALRMEEVTGLIDGVQLLDDREDLTAIVVAGHPEVFSTGVAVESIVERSGDVDATTELFDRVQRLYRAVETCSTPTVAVLEGPAVSAGCELALTTDLRVASEDAELALDGLEFGMVPPFERLRRIAGESVANDLCLTDRRLSAAAADRHGLFNRVVPSGEVDDAVDRLVASIEDKRSRTVEQFKRALRYADGTSVADTTEYRSQLEYVCFTDSEFAERAREHVREEQTDHA